MVYRIVNYPIPLWETQTYRFFRIADQILFHDPDFNRSLVHGTSTRGSVNGVHVGHVLQVFYYGTRGQSNALLARILSCYDGCFRLRFFRSALEDISSAAGVFRLCNKTDQDVEISSLDGLCREKWKPWFRRMRRLGSEFLIGELYQFLKTNCFEFRMI